MATGIANAIIYVRGIDMLSRTVGRAAAATEANLKALERKRNVNTGKIDSLVGQRLSIEQRISDLGSSTAIKQIQQMKSALDLSLKRQKIEQQINKLTTYQTNVDPAKSTETRIKNLQKKSLISPLSEKDQRALDNAIAKLENLRRNPPTINRIGTQKTLTDNQKVKLEGLQKRLQANNLSEVALSAQVEKTNSNYKYRNDLLNASLDKNSDRMAAAKLYQASLSEQIRSEEQLFSIETRRAKIANMQSKASTVGLMASALVTLPIMAGGLKSVSAFADYEKSLKNIQSIGMQTESQMKSLDSWFRSLSTDITKTNSSATDLAEAYYEVQSSGFFAGDAQKIVEASTRAATAGLADQLQTAKATTIALNAYGESADSAGKYTDVMMRAVDIGIFRFEDLTQQMGDFVSAAGMLEIPIEEVLAALTAMTKKGIPIAEAATSLNRIMMNFLKPAKSEVELAESLGIELSTSAIKANGFANTMTDVINKTKGSEDALAQLFGEVRGIRGVFALGSDGLKMYNKDLEQLRNSSGTVSRVFATQQKSLAAQFNNLKNKLSVTAISFGEILAPSISVGISKISEIINVFWLLSNSSKETIINFAKIAAAIGPVMLGFSGMLAIINSIIGVTKFFSPQLTAGLLNVASGAKAAAFGINILGVSLGTLLGAVAIFGAIAVAIYGVVKAVNAWEAAQEAAERQKHMQYVIETGKAYEGAVTALDKLTDSYEKYNSAVASGKSSKDAGAAEKELKQSARNAYIYVNSLKDARVKELKDQYAKLYNEIAESGSILQREISAAYNMPLEEVAKLPKDSPLLGEFSNDIQKLETLKKMFSDVSTQLSNLDKENFFNDLVYQTKDATSGIAGINGELAKMLQMFAIYKKISAMGPFNKGGSPLGNFEPQPIKYEDLFAEEATRRAKGELEGYIEKYNELTKKEKELSDIGISINPLQNTPEELSKLDAYIEKMKKVHGVTEEVNALSSIRVNLGSGFTSALSEVMTDYTNGNYVSALNKIKDGFFGTGLSVEDFAGRLNELPPYLKKIAIELLDTDQVLNNLRDDAKNPIEIRIQLLVEGMEKIDNMLVGLSSTGLGINKIMTMQADWQRQYKLLVADLEKEGITGLQREIELQKFWDSKDAIINSFTDVKSAGTSAAKSIDDAFSDASSKIQGYFGSGMNFSKGLGNLLPGGENGVLGPGGNGAFEALYRIQDIAMSKTRGKGADTDKWMAMYGLNPDTAAEIVKKFQMGIFDADVMKYVDSEALINTAKLEMIAEQSQKALAEKLAKESGLSKDVFLGMFGMNQKDKNGNTILPSIDVNGIRTKIANDFAALPNDPSTARNLLGVKKENLDTVADEGIKLFAGSFSTAKDNNAEELKKKGEELWDKVGEGVINKASSDTRFKSAVYKMVVEALANG